VPADKDTCARCGSTPATLFHCDSGTSPAIALCDDCLAAFSPWNQALEWNEATEESSPDSSPETRCNYCGASPCSIRPDTLGLMKGTSPRPHPMCLSCSREYDAVLRPKLRQLLQSPPAADPFAAFARLEEEIDCHMRRHVALRHN